MWRKRARGTVEEGGGKKGLRKWWCEEGREGNKEKIYQKEYTREKLMGWMHCSWKQT